MKQLSRNRLAMIASLKLSNCTYDKVVNIWIKYETEIQCSIKNKGKLHTLGRYKESYVFLRNYLLELPTQPISFTRVDKLGLPKTLWSLRPLIKGNREEKRVALSIARGYEQIRLEIDYSDTSAITDKHSPSQEDAVLNLTRQFNKFLKQFTRHRKWYLGYLSDPIQPYSKVLTTLSKGPNGPAVASSHLDARAVINDKELYSSLMELNQALGQNWITSWMEQQSESYDGQTNLYTGRLGFSAEPGGKTRKFAIGDYWSQLSLKPIQISLYRTLKSIPTDTTANQNRGFLNLVSNSRGKPTYCFDLSSASDRIPASMQKYRLQLMKDRHLADSWYKVMTRRNFRIKPLNKDVRWAVGQPLGLLSSFPSFALWHHDIIQFAANYEKFHNGKPLKFFKEYALLGDDVVIYDAKVARRYQRLMNDIGVTINITKSIIGDKNNGQIEFAKRLALRGQEMSSIKHNILQKNSENFMLDLVGLLCERDFIAPDTDHYGLHRVLKSENLQRLKYMLWLRSSTSATLKISVGKKIAEITREDMIQRITSKRTSNIIQKAMKIRSFDMEEALPLLLKSFKSISVSCSEKTLTDRSIGDLKGSHPIVLSLTQTSRELQFLMFTVLDDLEPNAVSPVEYLPVVSEKSYFSNLSTTKVYLSKILLECFQEALDEIKLMNTYNTVDETCTGNIIGAACINAELSTAMDPERHQNI